MSWLMHHTQSEEYTNQADKHQRQQNYDQAAELYRLAADAEAHALDNLDLSKTRTLGITAVSVVSLYYKAQDIARAKRIAYKWLATELLPAFAINELEEFLQVIRYEESLKESRIQFIGDEILISVSGGDILYGAAPLEVVLHVGKIRSIFYRTTEFLLGLPLRTRGEPIQEVQNQCDPWLFQASSENHQFMVRMRKPQSDNILTATPDSKLFVKQIIKKFFEIVRVATQNPGELTDVVPPKDYRKALLNLIREFAPPASSKSFNQIDIRAGSDIEIQSIILRPDTRQLIQSILDKFDTVHQDSNGNESNHKNVQLLLDQESIQLRGILRGLQLSKDWIEVEINDENLRVYGVEDKFDDVIGSMVNRRVVLDVIEHFDQPDPKYSLGNIQLEENVV